MKGRRCRECGHCKRVYTRGHYRFWQERLYYCREIEKMTDRENCCEEWQKRKREYDLSKERFEETEEDIKAIGEYLKERGD